MAERLPAHLEAGSLIRRAQAEGGFGTVIRRGDKDRGSLLLLVAGRGEYWGSFERALLSDGNYGWQRVGPAPPIRPSELREWSEKRVRFDEDLWLIELDVADPERFVVETGLSG